MCVCARVRHLWLCVCVRVFASICCSRATSGLRELASSVANITAGSRAVLSPPCCEQPLKTEAIVMDVIRR